MYYNVLYAPLSGNVFGYTALYNIIIMLLYLYKAFSSICYTLYVGKIGVASECIAYSSILKLRSCNARQSCNYYYVVYYALLQPCNSSILDLYIMLRP